MSDPSVVSKLTQSVDAQMPALTDELTRLVGIPSVSEWGFPAHTRPAVLQAHDVMVELLTGAHEHKNSCYKQDTSQSP